MKWSAKSAFFQYVRNSERGNKTLKHQVGNFEFSCFQIFTTIIYQDQEIFFGNNKKLTWQGELILLLSYKLSIQLLNHRKQINYEARLTSWKERD